MRVKTAEFYKSSAKVAQCPQELLPDYAFIGRSNVGKSSLINSLCRQNKLAKTSSTPGKTQLINHFLINKTWFLVDLPGYGFTKVPVKVRKKWELMTHHYLTQRKQLTNIFVLIDSRHEPMQIDLDFMAYLAENQLPFSIVFTKADKNSKKKLEDNIHYYKTVLGYDWEELPPIFITSAKDHSGRNELLNYIDMLNDSFVAPAAQE